MTMPEVSRYRTEESQSEKIFLRHRTENPCDGISMTVILALMTMHSYGIRNNFEAFLRKSFYF